MAKILGILGGDTTSSNTQSLIETILGQFQNSTQSSTELLDLAEITNTLDEYYFQEHVVTADVIVIGTAIPAEFKSGIYKHFFDCINPKLLAGKIILLIMTGNKVSPLKNLENQLRPLLLMFGAKTVPISIFALDSDFIGNELINLLVKDQIGEVLVKTISLLAPEAGFALPSAKAA
jgi:FMN reductase